MGDSGDTGDSGPRRFPLGPIIQLGSAMAEYLGACPGSGPAALDWAFRHSNIQRVQRYPADVQVFDEVGAGVWGSIAGQWSKVEGQ